MTVNILTQKRFSLIHGVGINDSPQQISWLDDNGRRHYNALYRTWKNMLERCYSPKLHARCPTYIGCSVCKEWLTYSSFYKWIIKQDYKGKQLDKDALVIGNKIYSPETCCFVSKQINQLLTYNQNTKSKYPTGVYWNKQTSKYTAQISKHGKVIGLGRFTTANEAESTYLTEKIAYIIELSRGEPKNIKSGLLRHANKLKNRIKALNNEN